MKKVVVLFNLETNGYLDKNINIIKDWKFAKNYPSETHALEDLHNNKKTLVENNKSNWCTRTFYSLGKN